MQGSSKPHVNTGDSGQEKLLAEFAYQPAAEGRKHAGEIGNSSSDKVLMFIPIQHELGQNVSSDPCSSTSTYPAAQQSCAAAQSVSAHSCRQTTFEQYNVAISGHAHYPVLHCFLQPSLICWKHAVKLYVGLCSPLKPHLSPAMARCHLQEQLPGPSLASWLMCLPA